ncbi:MAG: hypothetical protein JNJ90_01025, partial [Saprospiraceae bacterium]|nr:hypothetical protein [Saprospiraceae bacterium]
MKNNIHPCGRFFSAVLLVAFSLIQGQVSAQTTLLSASGDGGFENGPSFAANGWTVVNGSGVTNKWFVGTVPTLFPGSNSAYVSDDAAGATHNFNNAAGSIVHFYRDVTLPAGETNLTYGYQWYAQGESTYDFVQISVGSTSIVPVAASGVAGSISPISLPLIPGTTVIGAHNLQGAVQTVTSTVSSAAFGNCFAPATIRIFFTWRNDGSGGTQPPVALDNIFLESAVPAGGPISGTKTIGPGGDYPTLTAAVAVIAQNGVSSPVILELQANYTSAGETFPIVLGGQSSCNPVSSTNTVTIRPAAGATALSIIGTNAGPAIDINGGNWWRIDGRPGGVGTAKELTISNTSTSGQAVRFINEGSNNIIRYTILRGVNTSTASGVVVFSTTTGANGNDNNLIEFCDIRDGATSPLNCVYSSATTTTLAQYNNNNTIGNCNIFNYFGATSSHVGVFLAGGNTGWTVSGNSFYQTTTRSTTGTVNAFQSSSSLNNNLTVTNNFIGGSEPNAGGTAMTYTGGTIIRAFLVTVGTLAPSNFNNNTFRNISVTTTSTSTAQSMISLLTGRINCNDNTIGSQTTNNSIVFSLSGSAARLQAILAGTGTPELTTINNNTIGGMALIVTGAPATVPAFFPISVQGTTAGHNFTVTNNTIGSPTVANSVTSDANSSLIAIISFSGAIGQTYNNNLIANITATNTGTGTTAAGMNLQGTGTSPNFTGSFTANGNTMRNISTQSGATFVSAYGLSVSGTAELSAGQTVTNNIIHSISNTNTGSAASIAGMLASLPSANASTISGNTIHSLSLSTSTTTAAIRGVILNAGRPVLANNFIRLGINPDGSDIITSYNMQGILENTGTIGNVYHNSVYIGGAGVNVGASNSFAFISASTAAGRNYRNNIFFNARSNAAGTGKHYAMSITGSAPNQAGLISDYNLLNATGTGGFIGLFNAVDQATLADWRSATGFDFNSITGDPQFINPNGSASTVDLHISAANPTPVEGAGVNAGVVNDADGQTRSNFSPVDIGADAGNFVVNDISGPGIGYTALPSVCGTGDINLNNVNITDATGIPLTGNLRPRVYYRKAAGSWFSQPGILVSGTAQNSLWNFTMVAADMGGLAVGDIVQYYVIAQDNNGTPLIASVAGGVAATDVNNVTTHPAGAFTATVINQLSGTYTVGTGGDYPTLTAAVAAYNSSCLGGAVVFSLIDATYSSSETFPITINANAFANSTNTLTIRPAAGNVATINGTSTSCIINLNGADWVIIDGSNSGGTDRSLTISNASTAAATAAVCVTSLGSNLGATNDVIKNCNIAAGSNSAATSFGIFVGGTSLTSSGTGNDNDNLTIQNNAISKALYGIYAAAVVSNVNDNLLITNNLIGSSANATDQIGQRGIIVVQANNAMISQNTIFNIVGTQTNPTGIFIGAGVINSAITRNDINSLKYTGTSGYGGKGIDVQTGSASSNLTISNNFIYDLSGDGWTALTSDAIIGIRIGTGSTVGGINVYNNSVNLFGNADRASSSTLSAALYIGSGGSNLDIRNNILKNDIVNNLTTTAKAYAINSASPASAFTFINNNDYYAAGSQGILGFLSSDILTLTNWQAATGKDGQSVAVQPVFTTNTDLHLTNTANYCLDGGGAPLAAVTVDIDGQARSATTPDIGADEFALVNMTVTATENSGVAPNDNLTCSGDPVTLTANAAGASYAWSSGGPGNPIVVNPATTTTYTCTVTDANGCTEVLAPVTITVNPLPTAFAVTGGGAYCAPGAGVPVGLDGSQSGVNYQLKRNNVNVGSPVAGTGNAISFGNQTVAGIYTVSANDAGINCSADMTGSAVVVENPTPVSFSVTGGGAYCSPGAGVPVGLGGSESGVNYQLQRGGSNVGAPVAGTGAALDFGNQIVAGIYTVVATHSNGGCTANMNGSAIVVENSTPTLTETHVEPTTCLASNGSINLSVNNGNAPFSYNWFTPNGSGLIQGQEDQSGLTVGIYSVTVTDNNSCSATLSLPLIGPGNCDACPIIGALSTTPAGICAGSNVTLNATGLVDMGTTYGITFKYFGAPSATPYIGGTVIGTVDNSGLGNNGTTATITTSFATGGVYYLYAILDQFPTDPACRPSASYVLTVLNIPSVNPVSNQTVCAGSNTAAVNFSGPVPGTVYNWTNNNTSIGLAAAGTGNIPAFAAINNGTAPVTATITVTPSVNDPVAGTVCTGNPITFTITVNPVPTVNAVANQTHCNGAAVPSIVFASNVPGAVINWSRTAQSIGLIPTNGTGSVPAFTAANATNAPVTATFTATATYTNNGIPCTGPAIQFTITINPTPTVSATPTSQTVCNGATTTQISLSGALAGTVYNWTNNTPSIGLAANGTGNIPAFAAVNTGGAPVTATITITPTYTNNGVFCSGTPIIVTITVNPTAQVNQPANVNTCGNALTTVTFTTTTPGSTYSWTNNNTAIGLAASGTGNISFTAANVAVATTGTITVTPNYTNNGVSCPGTPRTFTITVNPNPSVVPVANQPAICSGDATNAVAFTGPLSGTVFNWTNNNTNIGLAASGTGDIPSFIAQNPGTTIQTATITVTPSLTTGGVTCTGTPITFTYTVYPRPVVTLPASVTICQDQNAVLSATLGGGATGGTWSGGAGQF